MEIPKLTLGNTKREKALVLVLSAIFLLAIYYLILLRPVIGKLNTLLPKVYEVKRDLKDARFLITNKALIEKKKEELLLKLEEYEKIFPAEREIPKLLENLSSIAGESNVRIVSTRPFVKEDYSRNGVPKIYQEIPIEIVAKSGYHQLGQFLQKLETGDRYIMIKDVKISANQYNIKSQDVQLIASTYILIKK